MRKTAVLLLVLTISLSGCMSVSENGGTTSSGEEKVVNPYALISTEDESKYYEIEAMNPNTTPFDYEQSVSFDAEFPFPAAHRYYGDIEIRTLEREGGEAIYFMKTTMEGYDTPDGIGVGSSQEELFTAYGKENLRLKDTWEWSPDSGEPQFDTVYGYAPEDGTRMYIAFFLYEEVVVMVETADGLDGRPIAEF